MKSTKYSELYSLLEKEWYQPEWTVVWQRNRWRLQVWKGPKLYKLAMTGTREHYKYFKKRIEIFISLQKTKWNTEPALTL